jgi:hypothetical protein
MAGLLGGEMKIERTYFPAKSEFSFHIRLWRFCFNFYIDKYSIRIFFLMWFIEHKWGYKLFPPKSDYFADNTLKGRLKRFYMDSRFKHES